MTGCGPLFKDIMLLLENRNIGVKFAESRDVSKVKICPLSGKLATKHCPGAMEDVFIKGTEPHEFCPLHTADETSINKLSFGTDAFGITFPQDRDVFKIDPVLRPEFQRIKLKSSAPGEIKIDRVEWRVNGRKIGEPSYPFSQHWNLQPGRFIIEAIAVQNDQRLKSASVKIKVEE